MDRDMEKSHVGRPAPSWSQQCEKLYCPTEAAAVAGQPHPIVPNRMPENFNSPAPSARTGRSEQRYSDDGKRLVAGTIPMRNKSGAGEQLAFEDVEVLLVSCRRKEKGWSLPKVMSSYSGSVKHGHLDRGAWVHWGTRRGAGRMTRAWKKRPGERRSRRLALGDV